jgi:hypothetical protein
MNPTVSINRWESRVSAPDAAKLLATVVVLPFWIVHPRAASIFLATFIQTLPLMFSLILLGCVAPARAQAVCDMAAKAVTHSNSLQQASEPTGVDRCVFCHLAEVQGYARSAMAHALRPAGQQPDGTVIAHGTSSQFIRRGSGRHGRMRATK